MTTPAQDKYTRRLTLEETAKKNCCGVCGTQADVSYDVKGCNEWALYCPKCRVFNPPLLPKRGNRETIWRLQHMASPEVLAAEHELKKERDMTQALGPVRSQALAQYQSRDLIITEPIARQIVTTVWPEASRQAPAVVAKAVMLCHQYNLNPLLKEVHIIKYGTSYEVVLGIEANRKMAQRHAWFQYDDDTPRMMTAEEQEKFFGSPDKSKARAITILKDREGRRFIGAGEIALSATIQGQDKGNSHANMAQLRSERRAMKRLCPTLPDAPVMDEEYMPEIVVSDVSSDEMESELRDIGAEAEAEARLDAMEDATPKPKALSEASQPHHEGNAELAAELWPEEDKATWNFKTMDEAQFKAFCKVHGLSSTKAVCDRLGITSWAILAETGYGNAASKIADMAAANQ